ncbi:helicase-related protein [Pseudomonas aeruginosa]|uniref:helicase-related protein n=1 Tax=Pseudomonas aeruginosa TaxID=287 RepID=UPI000EB467F9|nr:helicase-related protein [Pseudomonas aeruginosa]HCT7101462.1 DNA/RNA helicase [Pseudomonas aeruginosa]HEN8507883.1 DNA/RNA helicase [Pseudomonas aeruginosa]HEN8756306.1 DNA/RNA helicase [Pseudomonas aeruginosa]HEN8806077.1 DNA/RNA helicase [Pseudomonas aeruginosa]
MTQAQTYPRDNVLSRLITDLIGPREPDERLNARPSDVYATGILWPQNSEPDPDDNDRLAAEGEKAGEEGTPADESEAVAASSLRRPSTAGLSFAVNTPEGSPTVSVLVEFGLYSPEGGFEKTDVKAWRRRAVSFSIDQLELTPGARTHSLTKAGVPVGISLHIRTLDIGEKWLTTLTLVNGTSPEQGRDEAEAATLFQTSLKVIPILGTQLVPRPSRRPIVDLDDEVSSLLYREAHEFAAGHTCAANWEETTEGKTCAVFTTWLPTTIVPDVDAGGHQLFHELSYKSQVFDAQWLATASQRELVAALAGLIETYRNWIRLQEGKVAGLPSCLQQAADENIARCHEAASRMEAGAYRINNDPMLLRAFQLANQAMITQYSWNLDKSARGNLRWRPFQLGFLLLAAESAVDPTHPGREIMDLLWFPTGGGKTEAYLGLIALTAFYRRLARGDEGAGVVAVMRYTLRLLTTQQFIRASALIMACEIIRRTSSELGKTPFSIGLWVGGDASPNSRKESYAALKGQEGPSPKQLEQCPACGHRLVWNQISSDSPVRVHCRNDTCQLHTDDLSLPIWTVDEDIYEARPTLLIGTVDKFAQIVRKPAVNHLFGLHNGQVPDLIVQDELHLISGPLGTVTGLYEAAFDLMLSSQQAKPKIIGSTATIRKAAEQVLALFNRDICQFPPPAIDHDDSGFAVTNYRSSGRRYVGVASAGRSAKYTLQAVSASLLQSAAAGFTSIKEADPYWTLVTYFNSLRELGGSLVLMQDDVNDSLKSLSSLRGEKQRIAENIAELTSRRSQEDVRRMLDMLAIPAGKQGVLDAVLATNMLSVGVDIPRLGLMLVYGQPKGIAEYIQATSRVGRGEVDGLVVSVLNSAKARDRSHFETFKTWHSTLYRDVEATSVTPFASRARDRALHAVLVAAVRHLVPGMLDQPVLDANAEAAARVLIEQIAARADRIDPDETAVKDELIERLDIWAARNALGYWLEYKPRDSLLQSAERAATEKALGRSPGEAWPTMNNMRSVETGTPFRLAEWLRANGEIKK